MNASTLNQPSHFLRARLRGLYVVTDERFGGGHLPVARAALGGGASIVQLRDKTSSLRELLPIARAIRLLTSAQNALFFINDRIDIALICGADGVHLGPDDCPVAEARRALGPHFLLGASCGTPEEAARAVRDGADYLGAGAVFGTSTKADAGAPIGLANLQNMTAMPIPIAAIGGINRNNIASIVAAGAAMACVVSSVARAGDENDMARATRDLIAAACFR